jgi:IclR family KDG regulon transcriptional repressor
MKKKLIQSVLRAVKILDIVSRYDGGINLKDISKELGLGSSTVFYLINTLVEVNFIKHVANNKYKLGPKNLQLGNNYLNNLSLYKVSNPIIEELLEKINENIYLFMLENQNFIQILKMESSHSVKPTKLANDKSNAHATAIGKIFLSSFEDEECEKFINEFNHLQKYTKNTIASLNSLKKELDLIRKNGYSLDMQESEIGINCIAVPIYNHLGKIKASMGVSIPTQRFPDNFKDALLPSIKASANKISRELGYNI